MSLEILETLHGSWMLLRGCAGVPTDGFVHIDRRPNTDLGVMTHGILGIGDAFACRSPRPGVRFDVGLLQHTFCACQVPATELSLIHI